MSRCKSSGIPTTAVGAGFFPTTLPSLPENRAQKASSIGDTLPESCSPFMLTPSASDFLARGIEAGWPRRRIQGTGSEGGSVHESPGPSRRSTGRRADALEKADMMIRQPWRDSKMGTPLSVSGWSGHGPWLVSITHSGVAAEIGSASVPPLAGPGIATFVFAAVKELHAAVIASTSWR
jgi:hypothetical protein